MTISIPVYYTQEFKTKPSKTFLVSLNWYRNAHHFQQNLVKHHFHEILHNLLKNTEFNLEQYKVDYTYHYKSKTSDLPNVGPMASKWFNDYLQESGKIKNDNVQFLLEEHYYVGTHDRDNPRIDITISPIVKE